MVYQPMHLFGKSQPKQTKRLAKRSTKSTKNAFLINSFLFIIISKEKILDESCEQWVSRDNLLLTKLMITQCPFIKTPKTLAIPFKAQFTHKKQGFKHPKQLRNSFAQSRGIATVRKRAIQLYVIQNRPWHNTPKDDTFVIKRCAQFNKTGGGAISKPKHYANFLTFVERNKHLQTTSKPCIATTKNS